MSVQNTSFSNVSSFNSYNKLLESLPRNLWIVDSFQKAHSLICTGKYKKVLCAISGGSDSDLLIDILTKIDTEHIVDYAFFDTGLEYKATKDHLDYLEKRYNIKIKRSRALTPVPLAVKKVGQPFLNKEASEYIYRLQKYDFKWQDKSYKELIKEYPDCDSALKWWCNCKSEDKDSRFNINRNKWLKEFLIKNPPYFPISSFCCKLTKKDTAKELMKDYDLMITGERKAEGGARAGHNTCITTGKKHDKYKMLFWYKKEEKSIYEKYAKIEHSECYTEYGLKRTGCAGCPFGRNFEYELEVLKEHEPLLYKAACTIFKESYEYTRQYKKFYKEKELEIKRKQFGYQLSLFDDFPL